jgi:3-dehydroquinate dehydratase-2
MLCACRTGAVRTHFRGTVTNILGVPVAPPDPPFASSPWERPDLPVTDRPTVLVLNGPNLNMLGVREPAVYGQQTLGDIEVACAERADTLGLAIDFRQSNHEGELIDWLHDAVDAASGVIVNAGGLTHTSVALMDALKATGLPVVEVHLSNIFRRDAFRHHSYISLVAEGVICGFGAAGYLMAIDAMAQLIDA